jgi:hypothetical protein
MFTFDTQKFTKIAAVAMIFATTHANAAFESGNSLLAKATSSDPVEDVYFLGYVVGVADRITSNPFGTVVCLPSGVTKGQVSAVVKKWLENNPATLHYGADGLILDALHQSFPCPKKAPSK